MEQGYQLTRMPVGRLLVDTSYQRATNENRIDLLHNNWDEGWSGTLDVNNRDDDSYYVYDGNHRRAAALKRFGEEYLLACKVYKGLPVEEEARRFVELNRNRKQIKVIELAKSGLRANDPEWTEIAKVLNQFGLNWSAETRVSGDRSICCWKVLRDINKAGGTDRIEQTLRLLIGIWDGAAPSLEGVWVDGMSDFIRVYSWSPNFDESRIIERLSEWGPEKVTERQTAYRAGGVPVKRAYRKAYQELFNRGLRSGRLLTKAEAEE